MTGALEPLLDEAVRAFEVGDAATCIRLTAGLLDTETDQRVALLLGEACRASGDNALLLRAAERLLALNPSAVRAHIWRGDAYDRLGNARASLAHYNMALNEASNVPVPPALAAELRRVEQKVEAFRAQLLSHLDTYLTANGMPPQRRSARIAESLDLLAGTTQVEMQLQRPTVHFVPGLPQRGWYDPTDFGWAEALEAETAAIRDELLTVLSDDGAFQPYVEGDTNGPARDYQGLLDNPAWSAFYLWKNGEAQTENISRCPLTAAAIARLPQPDIGGRTPTAMFSLLRPGTHIPPHHGMLNCRLIGHLPLIVPDNCAMRVADQTRPWVEGQLAIFDDSVEHEAWNHSDQTRVVLLFDIWRPEIDASEREAIRLCFAAINEY